MYLIASVVADFKLMKTHSYLIRIAVSMTEFMLHKLHYAKSVVTGVNWKHVRMCMAVCRRSVLQMMREHKINVSLVYSILSLLTNVLSSWRQWFSMKDIQLNVLKWSLHDSWTKSCLQIDLQLQYNGIFSYLLMWVEECYIILYKRCFLPWSWSDHFNTFSWISFLLHKWNLIKGTDKIFLGRYSVNSYHVLIYARVFNLPQ
jgi:hypothetical protein